MNNLLKRLISENEDGERDFFSPTRIRLAALVLCLVCGGVGLFFENWLVLLEGLALGYCIAVLLFRQHELSVNRMLGGDNAEGKSRMGYFMRMLIRGIAIFIAVMNPGVSIFGCVCGLLSVPYGIYALAFIDSFIQSKNQKGGKE